MGNRPEGPIRKVEEEEEEEEICNTIRIRTYILRLKLCFVAFIGIYQMNTKGRCEIKLFLDKYASYISVCVRT
jgi:hypothetical protein